MTYRLTTFGPPSLTDEHGETPPGLGPGKPLAVLCYLAREGEVRRERVTALLWGERSESKARNAFRQALHRLRSALGDDVVPHDPDTVRIAAGAALRVDSLDFERALAEGRPEDAVALVTGDFLEGFTVGEPAFDHWADGERARLRGRFLAALRDAADEAVAEGRFDDAVTLARRLAREEPLDSGGAILEARTLTAAGRVEEARRLLEDFAERYRRELGEAPPDQVADTLETLETEAAEASGPPPADPVLRPDTLNDLIAAWRRAAAGEGVVVLLEGPAGAGKTWLIDELVRRIRPLDRPVVLRGDERMGRQGLPFAPVAEALRGVLRARGLAGASTHLLGEAARLLPELRDRFDLPEVGPMEDETGRLRLYEGVASVLDAVAYEQPVLLALEGLHDADPGTAEMIHFLATRLAGSPILFLLSSEGSGEARSLARRLGARAERLELGPVDRDALGSLVAVRGPDLGPMARAEVAAAADGNPGRALVLADRLARGEPMAGVPATMDDVLRSRVAACEPRERRALVVLALVARPLPVRLVAAATHLPEGRVLEVVESLRGRQLVAERDRGVELPPGPVRRLVLEAVGDAGRGLLAGWAAEALEAEGAATDAELAWLWAEAGRREVAARHAEAAGRAAGRVGATAMAVEHYRRARDWTADPETRARLERVLEGLGEGGRRLAAVGGDAGDVGDGGDQGDVGDVGERGRARPSRRRQWGEVVVTAALVVIALLVLDERPAWWPRDRGPVERMVRDTLVLVRMDPGGGTTRLGFTGDPGTAAERRAPVLRETEPPRWVDSLAGVGLPVLPARDRSRFAVVSGAGPGSGAGEVRLLVVSADRADTAVVARSGPGSLPTPLGWAPDGSRLLYRVEYPGPGAARRPPAPGLWIGAAAGGPAIAVDTTGHEIVAAAWSPDGTRVAWTARTEAGTRDVWTAFADGTGVRRRTGHAADDYHIAWAPGGERVAFTSDRTGDAEIWAVELATGRLWRLTWDPAHDDRPAFSPDGEYLAFESTRGGEAAVYVVSSWGGQPQRVTGPGQRVRHDGWRGYPPPYLSHLRFELPPALAVGEAGQVVVEPVHTDYVSRYGGAVRWEALDTGVVALAVDGPGRPVPGAAATDTFVVGRSAGLGRVAVSAGGWRVDTVYVKVGTSPIAFPGDGPERTYPLDYGLWIAGTLPGSGAGPAEVTLAAPGGPDAGEPVGPVRIAALRWEPGGGRVTFGVEREEHTERVSVDGPVPFSLSVGDDGRVTFAVGETVRWRSTLRVTGTGLPVHRVAVEARGGAEVAEIVVQ